MASNGYLFEGGRFVPPKLGQAAERTAHLRVGPGRSLWRYRDGVYVPNGEEWLAGFVRRTLGEEFRENRLREVRAWCRANVDAKLPRQPSTDYINVANGLLWWKETPPRLEPHSPDVTSIIQIPVSWEPEAKCAGMERFLRRVLPRQDLAKCYRLVLEWMGYMLVPSARLKRALLLEGPGDTGKSTLLNVFGALLGPANVSHATLQSIADDRFAAADLYGRLANISADLDARAVQRTGMFKMLVSGDPMRVERKFEQPFNYRPFTRLVFSANEAPGTTDQSDAYYGRWLILPMHARLDLREQDPHLVDELTSPGELAGLLRNAVAALKILMARGRFDPPPVMLHAAKEYRARTDTVVGFVEDACLSDPQARERAGVLYEAYGHWCRENGRQAMGRQRVAEHLKDVYALRYAPRHAGYPTWFGLRLRTPADQHKQEGHGDFGDS
ncbi:MAG: phage/plasmid primase, P4 family [Actinomycetota bacterium]|nr:phage/plasmid primase, P4 family [Actinomycetota bacterium]